MRMVVSFLANSAGSLFCAAVDYTHPRSPQAWAIANALKGFVLIVLSR